MAKCGELLCFHGAYNKKSDAEAAKVRKGIKGFIRFMLYPTGGRFVIVTKKKARGRIPRRLPARAVTLRPLTRWARKGKRR
jgi:hypothetical protein